MKNARALVPTSMGAGGSRGSHSETKAATLARLEVEVTLERFVH